MEFPPIPCWMKYSLKWFSKMNLSISDIRLPLGPRESWSKTSRILSIDQDEIASRKSALIHPKSMKASIKWVIEGTEVSRKVWMSRYRLGSCIVQVTSGSMFIEGMFDREWVWDDVVGAVRFLFRFLKRVRRPACRLKTKWVAKYSLFLLSSDVNISGCSSLSCTNLVS